MELEKLVTIYIALLQMYVKTDPWHLQLHSSFLSSARRSVVSRMIAVITCTCAMDRPTDPRLQVIQRW